MAIESVIHLKSNIPKFVVKTKAMKKLSPDRIILNSIVLTIIGLSMHSCIKKEDCYDQSIVEIESARKLPVVDFKLLDCLDESNQKTIELSSIIFDLTTDVKTLQLLIKIKKNHRKFENELHKLTKENLIIIPQLTYHIYLNPNSVKSKNGDLYLLKTLETELENQIIVFDHIDKTSENIDFRIFAIQSKKIVENNNKVLSNIINNLP
jgi:hypothetical protein